MTPPAFRLMPTLMNWFWIKLLRGGGGAARRGGVGSSDRQRPKSRNNFVRIQHLKLLIYSHNQGGTGVIY